MDSKGNGIVEDISPIDSPISWSTFSEPIVYFVAMDNYCGVEPDPLGILPRDAEAWELPIPENG
jgi:hypothetical protein